MKEQLIRVGHSPDPDDAFMFYGLSSGKVKLEGITIQHFLEDIQSLNQRAMRADHLQLQFLPHLALLNPLVLV